MTPRFERLDLNLLVVLDALLTERNVTRAGVRLGLSQPATSNALARLRKVFDDDLLVRVGHGLELTAQARLLAGPVHDTLAVIRTTIDEPLTGANSTLRVPNNLRVAISDHAALLLLPDVLNKHPAMTVDVTDLDSAAAERMLGAGEIDLVVAGRARGARRRRLDATTTRAQVLYSDTWACVSWRDAPTVNDAMSLDRFLTSAHVGYQFDPGDARSVADDHFSRVGVERRVVARARSFVIGGLLVIGTPHLAVLPAKLGLALAGRYPLTVHPLPVSIPGVVEEMMWSTKGLPRPATTELRRALSRRAKFLSSTPASSDGASPDEERCVLVLGDIQP